MEEKAPVVTEKPWGRELLLRRTPTYVVKILCVRAGCRLSLQYHEVKRETLLLGSGSALLEIHRAGEVIQHSLDEAVEVAPGTAHRVVALEDSEIVEVSTTELDDVVRLEDDYGRKGR
jgi:mannose-6-phosphate isomerase-like protein (cupin superfamily)